ncbi:sensor histidine kinase [Pseudoduganella umbonata]|uniref:Signal transduction histidine kinase/ligand-binding sensor domain-containing protein n=1 Tax=Pseudoduganella umbonata TaxID=864828 RepID=A0A4P8HIH7_9BURK|nr:sensor histidine kinase [Pseudoduganella umbonata]MBB3225173.1 signal transduction histidine kinase/ligand-binding sensor domain-containing protein [Pseudoduganella umbonata]QCP09297.1 hypothetical protein FCL38_01755 [Pseudoduganella umbonata]
MKPLIAAVLGLSLLAPALPFAAPPAALPAEPLSAEPQPAEPLSAEALPAEQPAIPLLHARWLTRDGAPPNIQALAQTPDGWLWLASPTGLFRFDGVTFSRYRPPPGLDMPVNIRRMGTLPDGRLWVAPYFGDLYVVDGEKVQVFLQKDGFAGGLVNGIAGTRDGRLWLASGSGLHVLDKGAGQWRKVNKAGSVRGGIFAVQVDAADTVWAQGSRGNFRMRPGETHFTLVAPQQVPGSLVRAPDGAVWASDGGQRGLRRADNLAQADAPSAAPGTAPLPAPAAAPASAPSGPLDELLRRVKPGERFSIDSRGNFWFPLASGVLRIAFEDGQPRLQGFTARQGLSGDRALVAFEDREGSVWVATQNGLDQFRPSRMREIALPPYLSDARPLVAGAGGSLWIDRSWLSGGDAQPETFGPPPSEENLVSHLYRDRHGTVWGGGYGAIWKMDGLRQVPIAVPEPVRRPKWLAVFSFATGPDDALWVSFGPGGTFRAEDGGWVPNGGHAALKDFAVTTMATAADGAIWFGSIGSAMAILRGGRVEKFGPAQGLDIGGVLQIVPDASGAWLGGDEGIARFDGQRARRIRGAGGEQFAGASGVVFAPDGTLWTNTARGLFGIAGAELQRTLADPGYRVRFRRYDENDGLFGTAPPMLPAPSMVRTAAGELVMSTTSGVYRFDPARAPRNRVVPPVHVTGIAAAGRNWPAAAQVRLPAGPGNVRIDYTALSLAVPHRVRFQYRLEGVDAGWQDAGERRSAFYTRLEPGTYTFRVKAANDDGLWNEQGAQVRVEIPPTVTQTTWFKVLCALALALAAFGLHRLRLRMALQRMTRTFEARVAERERIARDLHDTLLQSVQGLIMHFRRIALRTPDDAPTRPMMQEALSLAAEVLEEGRSKVGELRVGEPRPAPDGDLAAPLEAYGRRLAAPGTAAFTVTRDGAPRPLHPPVHDEVLAIAQEAIRNAFLHAQAARIDVALHYGEHEFTLAVRDDGTGIDSARRDGRTRHWGIPGMRERAAELGAALELSGAPGQGTCWCLRLPARLAYAGDAPEHGGGAGARQGELQ